MTPYKETEREKRFHELDDKIEELSVEEQNFMLWQLLERYKNRIGIPEKCETVGGYAKSKLDSRLFVCCEDLADYISFELWH